MIGSACVASLVAVATVAASPLIDLQGAIERAERTAGAPVTVRTKRATGLVSFLRRSDGGDLHPAAGRRRADDKAQDFLMRHGELFGLGDAGAETVPLGERTGALGWTHVLWQQVHGGVEVFGATLRAHLTAEGGLRAVNGATVAIGGPLATTPTVSGADAERIAVVGTRGAPTAMVGRRLVIYARGLVSGDAREDQEARLAHAIELEDSASGRRELVLVDALDGRVLDRIPLTPDALVRQVSHTDIDDVVWIEGDPDPIPPGWVGGSVQQVAAWQDEIDGARESYNFHGSLTLGTWLSYDGADAVMKSLHDRTGFPCPNASWNGLYTTYCPGVTSDDVVSHEWGHAYTEYTAGLIYIWQTGALNESYSDVWGETVDLLNGRHTDAPGPLRAVDGSTCSTFGNFNDDFPATDASVRWLVSEDSTGFGSAIRDMWHPECRFDPGRVGSPSYVCGDGDSGGVHSNSGVPNHLYALLVDGGDYNGTTVPAIGLTKAANILWRAVSVYETPVSDFADHADAVEQSCADLIGAPLGEPVVTPPGTWTTSAETIAGSDCAAVATAVAAVELRDDMPCDTIPILQPNPPPLCEGLGAVESLATYDFETALAPWTAGTRDVANPLTYDGGTWVRDTSPPDGHPGAVAFTADPIIGDCELDDETGVSFLESPPFVVPVDRATLHVTFVHWIATEPSYDGGNVKVSVNGGPFVVVPAERFAFNAYNDTLTTTNGNTDPMAGEAAWTGTDSGQLGGSWGESQLDVRDLAEPGDTVRVRFELGMDGCNGRVGWYVDDVRVYTCAGERPLCPETPHPGCKQAPLGRSKLVVKDDANPTRDRLQWSWARGAATTLADTGEPLATTRYGFCVWDGRAGVPTLVAHAEVDPGVGWKANTKVVSYGDKHGTGDGVSRIKVKLGIDGKASASVQAKGANLDVPIQATGSTRFAADPAITVQLVTSVGTCWESTFTPTDLSANTLPKAIASHVGP
jgi:Zn-dependent metalloprotease